MFGSGKFPFFVDTLVIYFCTTIAAASGAPGVSIES